MSGFWGWLFYTLPFPLQAGLVLLLAAALLFVATLLFGWQRVRPFVLPLIGLLGAVGLLARERKAGHADRVVEEKIAEAKAEKTVETERGEAAAMDDVAINDEVSRWTGH